ncbi:MAG: TolC family protein, partial [Pseudogulbenkiania sp.]|nr:TolC family protein [Pseudogulbenkiania sp.]
MTESTRPSRGNNVLARSRLAGLIMMLALPVAAMDLKEAWGLLKRQGPSYLAAEHEREAGQENRALGLAGLLPQITASVYKNRIDGTSEHPDIFGREQTTPLNYDSQGGSVQLRQSLLNWPKMAEYRQGEQKTRYSEAVFDAKSQDAAVDLAGRYLDVLLAYETIAMAEAKVKAFEEQRAASQRRFDLGDGTVTDIDEATARRDLAQAERLEAQSNLQTSLRLLQELLGDMPTRIAGLQPASFATPALAPAVLADWLAEAETHNPALHARQRAYDVAQEEYNRVHGQHLPSVDFVLGYTVGDS